MKKKYGLLFRFSVIFILFTLLALFISGVATYLQQSQIYKNNQQQRIRELTGCLSELIVADGYEFEIMQEYFLAHHEQLRIPYDYNGDFSPARDAWEEIYTRDYGSKVFEDTIRFEDMSEEAQLAFVTYKYEQWLTTFEAFNEAFGTEYVYYLIPTDHEPDMYYLFDGLRTETTIDGESVLEFDFDVEVPKEDYPHLWETWYTGECPSDFDSYDNQFGKTYGYYTPVYIDGKKIGIVCADIAVNKVNSGIVNNTATSVVAMSLILIVCILLMLSLIGSRYIAKLRAMENYMAEYADTKDVHVADKFESVKGGYHEITMLSAQTAAMIREMEDYIQNLTKAHRELDTTKKEARQMGELAHKDALTGIRNKTAYDKEIKQLEWELSTKKQVEFGIAMIDLNFLKKINDTFGHEQGNVAIIKLCQMVCTTFSHSPVFRIGGDEFAVILKGTDLQNRLLLVSKLKSQMTAMERDDSLHPWEVISAAVGVAVYSPEIDSTVGNVFKRADKAMYEDKKEMKGLRE